jgi:STE24 endopeptidase
MSRFLPLIILAIWLSTQQFEVAGGLSPVVGSAIFVGFYAVMVAVLGVWSRHVARAAHFNDVQNRLRIFNLVIYGSRIAIPVWLGAGIFWLGWKDAINGMLGHTALGRLPLDGPGLLLGCLPSFLTWIGIWWAQFPADRTLREQNILIQLNENLPVQTPPSFRTFFLVNLRLQLLFTLAPAIVLVLVHDSLLLMCHAIPALAGREDMVDALVTVPAVGSLIIFGPEILRRVLRTEPMPDCPLKRKLVEIAQRHRVRFHDVLLWKTDNQMGNAAVMGFVPRFRYVLISDLLLETMHDEQIEAIFAHEIGHVMHRHLLWLMAAIMALMLALAGPGQLLVDAMSSMHARFSWLTESIQMAILLCGAMGLFALAFGFVSRKFERQADVFAARTIQEISRTEPVPMEAFASVGVMIDAPALRTAVLDEEPADFVGRHGAAVFCSALERVAAVNNIPIAARSWCHGSIAKRMHFLEFLSRDARRTAQFDRFMRRLYLGLIVCLLAFGAWTIVVASTGTN